MFLIDDQALLALIREDVPFGDLTTRSLGFGLTRGHLVMTARDPMTLCAVEEAARIFELLGCAADLAAASGEARQSGDMILAAAGSAEALFTGWKVAQVLVEWAAGLASAARELVDAANAARPGVVVACTRKSVPGTRALALKAVTAGGAIIHRAGLSDTVLLFPEHRAFAPGCLKGQLMRLRLACPERHIVVEVTHHDEALRAAEWGADVVQLEKFAPAAVARVVAELSGSPVRVAAAGGINAANAADYAATGADVLVTSQPYYARPRDVAVTLEGVSTA
ncbi:ModD protein (plasmid) [Cereibacter azotoformans]|uniref:ModD protein n=1 Tax=Cereibacter azotoformans TaxID=43057 RepID=UPI000E35F76F|nr:ModD protein [Cereibacter azotoformans]AXQ96334.1 ModD protein [Cereibacter sphaeroides]UIJ33252.1 ModD protein [Cereibacter azotoformans]